MRAYGASTDGPHWIFPLLPSAHVSLKQTVPTPKNTIRVLPLSSLFFWSGAMSLEQYVTLQVLSPASAGASPPWSMAYTYLVLPPLPEVHPDQPQWPSASASAAKLAQSNSGKVQRGSGMCLPPYFTLPRLVTSNEATYDWDPLLRLLIC